MTLEAIKKGPLAWMAGNSVAANLLMLTFIVGGVMAIPRIRQEVFPSFEIDVIRVSVAYPGASPSEVEQGILLAAEEAVRGLDGVERVTASAVEGMGTVAAELLSDADGNKVLQDIKNEVDRIPSFPEEAEEPIVSLMVVHRPVLSIIFYGDLDEATLRSLAESAKSDIALDPRITVAEVSGSRPLEISIEVPLGKLREHNLTLAAIAEQVRRTSVELGGGGVKTPGGERLVRVEERRDYGSEYAGIPIASTPDGSRLLLSDIADVQDGFADVDQETLYNGQRAVNLTIYRVGDEDPVSVSKAAHEFVEKLNARLPATVRTAVVHDRSDLYRDRMALLIKNAVMGLMLVMLVLGLFLEVRLAFWVMLGIPISFIGCLLFLPYLDVSINMVSMFAFIVAIGIVVDDAIVVGESVYYERETGKRGLDAAVRGVRLVSVPVVFAILTNIIAFLPLLFVPGIMGQLWGDIPKVIIIIFAISLVESLLILPAHLAHQREQPNGWFWTALETPQRLLGGGLKRFADNVYAPFVQFTLRHRYTTVAIGLAILVLTVGWWKGGRLPFHLFPKVESDRVTATAMLPYGTPFENTREVAARLRTSAEKVLAPHGGTNVLEGIYITTGSLSAGFGPFGGDGSSGGHLTSVEVNLVPLDQRAITATEFTKLWRKETGPIPGVESLTFKFNIGPATGSPIDIELSHPDSDILEAVATRTAAALEKYAGVVEIDDGVELGKEQFTFTLKPAARSLGITALDLAQQVRHAFYGAEALRQQRGQDEIKVFVRLPKDERRFEDDIAALILRAPSGSEIPLREAAAIQRSRAYQEIKRVDGRRTVNVTADLESPKYVPKKILDDLTAGFLPELSNDYPNLAYSIEGEQREQRESMGGMAKGFLVALFALFALLAIIFKSYAHAVIVLIAIPFGIVGAIGGHILMGFGMSFVSIMGMVALAGVVINDNILLISTANEYRGEGMTAREAAAQAPTRRFRPVLLTSVTTFLGLAPMIFETSVQARFMIPMALSLGFGILFATFITLVLVPSLYLIHEDIQSVMGKE
jgi:multidrug efflux pump subunit AcrB